MYESSSCYISLTFASDSLFKISYSSECDMINLYTCVISTPTEIKNISISPASSPFLLSGNQWTEIFTLTYYVQESIVTEMV